MSDEEASDSDSPAEEVNDVADGGTWDDNSSLQSPRPPARAEAAPLLALSRLGGVAGLAVYGATSLSLAGLTELAAAGAGAAGSGLSVVARAAVSTVYGPTVGAAAGIAVSAFGASLSASTRMQGGLVGSVFAAAAGAAAAAAVTGAEAAGKLGAAGVRSAGAAIVAALRSRQDGAGDGAAWSGLRGAALLADMPYVAADAPRDELAMFSTAIEEPGKEEASAQPPVDTAGVSADGTAFAAVPTLSSQQLPPLSPVAQVAPPQASQPRPFLLVPRPPLQGGQ